MLKNPICEFLPPIAISQDVYDTLVLNAAKRLITYELDNETSLSKLRNQPYTVDELVFPGEGNYLEEITEWFFRENVSKVIHLATGSRRNPSNKERLNGLLNLEVEKNRKVQMQLLC